MFGMVKRVIYWFSYIAYDYKIAQSIETQIAFFILY